MNRIDQTFQSLKEMQQTAFIGFLTAGDPDIPTCKQCLQIMQEHGCDMIEIGIPFSDPIAEGPVVQEANIRALSNHITTDHVFQMIGDMRSQLHVPLVCFLYYNQIFKYGIDAFLKKSADAGIDALIIPDLPYEHHEEVKPLAKQYGIQLISLITPVSNKRKEMISKNSEGFLYCIPSMRTREGHSFQEELAHFMKELHGYSAIPKTLGFGISTAEQIKEYKAYTDGIIVDSAIVSQIAKLSTRETTLDQLGSFIQSLADATHK